MAEPPGCGPSEGASQPARPEGRALQSYRDKGVDLGSGQEGNNGPFGLLSQVLNSARRTEFFPASTKCGTSQITFYC